MAEVHQFIAEYRCPVMSYDPFAVIQGHTRMDFREKVLKLEKYLMEIGEDVDLPTDHKFAPGTYTRTIFMPRGSLVIGKIHKFGCINIITQGSCRVWTEDGEKDLRAGDIWVSEAGTKRVVLNFEDVVWSTVHQNPDNLDDLQLLEDQIILPSYDSIPILDVEAELPMLKEA